jgi:hypothetical protein
MITAAIVSLFSASILPFNTSINAPAAGGGGGSTLNTDLIAFWKMDEASGTRADSEPTGTPRDLSATAGITQETGKLSSAAGIPALNYLSITDNSDISVGNIDFTWSMWVYFSAKNTTKYILGKWGGSAATREYLLYYYQPLDRIYFEVSDGSTSANVQASSFGSPSLSTWYLVTGWHDSVNNVIGISVNAGTANTTAWTTGSVDTGTGLAFGAQESGGTGASGTPTVWVDEVGFWKKVLTSGERTELYNGGSGETCCPF